MSAPGQRGPGRHRGETKMNWRDRFNRFMAGRYGQDDFSRFLLIVALVLLVLEFLFGIPGFGIVIFLLLGYVYFRMFSRNIPARYAENQKYLQMKNKAAALFGGRGAGRADQKTHHIYKCPKCGQKIRIPKGKGMVEITCPKCRTRFRKRS